MPKPSLRGTGADLYVKTLGGKKIVQRVLRKSAFGRSIPQQVRFEAALQKFIGGQPFCANFISSDSNSITYEYIQGRDIFYSADGKKVGAALAALHGFSSQTPFAFAQYSSAESLLSSIRSVAMSKKETISRLAGAAAKDIFSLAEKNPIPPAHENPNGCIVHNDLTAGNILIGDNGTARIIDWSWAAHSDCALDLLSFTCPVVTSWEYEHIISEKAAKDFFSAYFSARQISDDEKHAITTQARSLAMPYFASMLLWLFSTGPESSQQKGAQERFSNPEFLKEAIDAVAKLKF